MNISQHIAESHLNRSQALQLTHIDRIEAQYLAIKAERPPKPSKLWLIILAAYSILALSVFYLAFIR